jgi:hypothetical protein
MNTSSPPNCRAVVCRCFAGVGVACSSMQAWRQSGGPTAPIAVALAFPLFLSWLPARMVRAASYYLGLMVAGFVVKRRYMGGLWANFSESVNCSQPSPPLFVMVAAISTGTLGLAALSALVPTRHGDALSGYMSRRSSSPRRDSAIFPTTPGTAFSRSEPKLSSRIPFRSAPN